MNTAEIQHALAGNAVTSPSFQGVFAADQVPASMPIPTSYVVNTDNAVDPGSHWVAFYQERPEVVEFFDSFGKSPSSYRLQPPGRVVQQSLQLQSEFSTVCGQYCMFFILRRLSGESYNNIVHLFTDSRENNDKMVCQYVNHHFDLRTTVYDVKMLKQIAKRYSLNL